MAVNRYRTRRRSAIHDAAVEAFRDLGFATVEDHNAPGAVGAGPMPMSTTEGRRVTPLQAYLPREAPPASLRISADSQVDTVLVGSGRARGVRLVNGDEIAADLVILAAGTYGSPPILMRSGVGPAAHLREMGIDVFVDLRVSARTSLTIRVSTSTPASVVTPRGRCCVTTIATFRSRSQSADGPPDLMFSVHGPSEDDGRL